MAGRNIVVLLDNVRLHKTASVLETGRRLGVTMLFSAQYSPFLNPIEQLFNYLKRHLRRRGALSSR